jgi:dihydropteroate synthase
VIRRSPTGLPSTLPTDRTLVMGVLNVTPDSFSDGGRFDNTSAAIKHGRELAAHGADLVDVGGESTRPGAHRISAADEIDRVVPVISELVAAGIVVSVDTMRAEVAQAAVAAGAHVVNDVSGGLADADMVHAVAELRVPYIVMHWRGFSDRMDELAVYNDVVGEVVSELAERAAMAVSAGISPDRLVIDPGLGFAKNAEHNWALLQRLDALAGLSLPVLLGASRKRFLGALLAAPDGTARDVEQREDATTAISAIAAREGVWAVRVHEPRAAADAVRVAAALVPRSTGLGR